MGLLRSIITYSLLLIALLSAIQFINNNQVDRFAADEKQNNKVNRLFAQPIASHSGNRKEKINMIEAIPQLFNFLQQFFVEEVLTVNAPQKFYALFTPEPLSPHFKQGGYFYGWNEDVVMTLGVMLLLACLDFLIVKPFMVEGARYYALHAVANSVAMVASAPDVFRAFFVDPATSFSGPSHTMLANSAVAAIHLWHCIAFNLSAADVFHHLNFVVTLCGAAIPGKHVGGVANNLGCFFLSGLPGGIDYVLLVLMKHGYLTKLQEKKYNCLINQWLRGPSMTIYFAIGWINWVGGKTTAVPSPFLFAVLLLHFYNGAYYAREVFESYARLKERERAAKEASIEDKKKN